MRKKTHPGEILMKEVITPNNLTIRKRLQNFWGLLSPSLQIQQKERFLFDEELAQSIKQAFGGNEKTWINHTNLLMIKVIQ